MGKRSSTGRPWQRWHLRAFEMDASRRVEAARDPEELALALKLQAEIAAVVARLEATLH